MEAFRKMGKITEVDEGKLTFRGTAKYGFLNPVKMMVRIKQDGEGCIISAGASGMDIRAVSAMRCIERLMSLLGVGE